MVSCVNLRAVWLSMPRVNVWVSDTENNRLEEFNKKGEFVRTVGSSGEGAGQFHTTLGVTVDSKGMFGRRMKATIAWRSSTPRRIFIKMFGWGVSNGESKLEICTSLVSHRFARFG